jgi:hypothetical protein
MLVPFNHRDPEYIQLANESTSKISVVLSYETAGAPGPLFH